MTKDEIYLAIITELNRTHHWHGRIIDCSELGIEKELLVLSWNDSRWDGRWIEPAKASLTKDDKVRID